MSDTQTKVLTNTVLKGIMTDAMVNRGVFSSDLDNATETGIYEIRNNPSAPGINGMSKYGTLMVIKTTLYIHHTYYPYPTSFKITRLSRTYDKGLGTWSVWLVEYGTPIS